MRLLVSVRNAPEAWRAVAGGAEIVDAKEPDNGSIGSVSRAELAAIRDAVPVGLSLSAALGDVTSAKDLIEALNGVTVSLSFVKLGFRGVQDPDRVRTLLAVAVERAARLAGHPAVIAVAYADHDRAGSLAPESYPAILVEAGADGLLVDTCFKDGPTLFDLQEASRLTDLGRSLEAHELLFALGGSLRVGQIPAARETGASIFGVRGAACRGGRSGQIDQGLVRQLADAVRLDTLLPHP